MTADAVGGIWTYALDLASALVRRGAWVLLAVVGPGLDADKRAAAAALEVEVVELGHPPEWLATDAAEVARAGQSLADLVRRARCDLLHLNHPALAADTRFDCPVVTVAHSCVATWWDAVKGTDLPPDVAWQAELVGRGHHAAATLVAPSQAFAAATRRVYALDRPLRMVHNGRAMDEQSSGPYDPIDAVFTAGRLWDEGKNVATLDRAAALIGAPFEAAGPTHGPNGASVTPAHLICLGALPDAGMRQRLSQRPVFASAALYEPFGLAVLEAAQAGCALVLSDIPSLREIWGAAAVFVPCRDAEGLASAIGRVLADRDVRARLGAAARARAGLYTLDAVAAGMAAIYADVLPTRLTREGTA